MLESKYGEVIGVSSFFTKNGDRVAPFCFFAAGAFPAEDPAEDPLRSNPLTGVTGAAGAVVDRVRIVVALSDCTAVFPI